MSKRTALSIASAAGLALLGCDDSLVCGTGSIEVDGACVSQADLPIPNTCGAGTTYNDVSGTCESTLLEDDFARCGPGTVRVVGDDGVPECQGTAACMDCSIEPTCPQPSGNRVTLCGRLYDLETTEPINDSPSDPGEITRLSAKVYDPIAFINDPDTATVLAEAELDACGYYQVEVALPFSGKVGIAVDDSDGAPDDAYVRTGVAKEADAGTRVSIDAFATRATTDMAWTVMAGDPAGGETFFEDGAYFPIFIDTNQPAVGPFEGTPVAGVAISRGATTSPNNDFYFSDSGALSRATIAPAQGTTGPNGSGLLIGFPGIDNNYTGQGPAGCTWPIDQAGMVGGAIFVQVREGQCN